MLQEENNFLGSGNLNGIKEALVVSNKDPKMQERILVRVAGVHNLANDTIENGVWAHHCASTRSGAGDFPEKGDVLYVVFPNIKDPMHIIWLGFARSSYQTEIEGTEFIEPTEPDSTTDVEKELTGANL